LFAEHAYYSFFCPNFYIGKAKILLSTFDAFFACPSIPACPNSSFFWEDFGRPNLEILFLWAMSKDLDYGIEERFVKSESLKFAFAHWIFEMEINEFFSAKQYYAELKDEFFQ
jgi:hypothetical protein